MKRVAFAAIAFLYSCTPVPVAPSPDSGDGGWAATCAKINATPGFIRGEDGAAVVYDCDAGAP